MSRKLISGMALVALVMASGFLGGMVSNGPAEAYGDHRQRTFSNEDFRGNYGMLELGRVAEGDQWMEVAIIRADGRRNIVIEWIGNIGGHTGLNGTTNCTYQVQPSGMGHMDCIGEGGEEIGGDFVLSDRGREVSLITTPSEHGLAWGTARLQ